MPRVHAGIRSYRLIVILLASVFTQFLIVENCFGYGRTWFGRDLERQIDRARLDLGPFRIRPVFVLTNAGYDSNIYYGATDEPVEDFTVTIGAAFDIYLPLKKKIIFHIYESPQYAYFVQTERERNWNNYFRGKVYFVFNRIFASAGVGRSEAKTRWNTEIDRRIMQKVDSVQGLLSWQPTNRTYFNLNYSLGRYNYGEGDVEGTYYALRLNRDETYFSLTAYRDITMRTGLYLTGEYGDFVFANASLKRDSKSYGAYGGVEFSPLGKIRGRLKLGYKFFDSLNPQRKDYKGIAGEGSVSVRLLSAVAARVFYKRDVQFSAWYDSTYFLEGRGGGGASLYLSKNVRFDYDFTLGRNAYPEELGVPMRRDDYWIHAVGIYFRLRETTAIGVIASRWVRDSNLDWGDDDRNFVGFNLTYDF